jgi:RNA polymerase sigma-70 factor (ECF subfamily)
LRITGASQDAEEAAQDALWTIARKIHTFKGESALGSWIYRIAANAAYQKLRWRRRNVKEIALDDVFPSLDSEDRHFEPMEDWSKQVDERASQAELRQVLTEAIETLPAEYRTVLVLHDVQGMPNQEIAAALGLSLPAVKSRVHRSRLLMRKRLSEYLSSPNGE